MGEMLLYLLVAALFVMVQVAAGGKKKKKKGSPNRPPVKKNEAKQAAPTDRPEAAPERPPMGDETKETDVQRAAFESDVLRGVVMSEVLTRPSERAALRRMKRGRRA